MRRPIAEAPSDPRIFHITHVENLAGILREGGLWSDAERIKRGLETTNIAQLHIKNRRLRKPMEISAKGMLGEYVPFNFCPRSVMLYSVHCGHSYYEGGQESVLHLCSRVSRATGLGKSWAFTDRHAELSHAEHFDDLRDLSSVWWEVMHELYWQDCKEERQAEFLVRDFFEWPAIEGITACTEQTAQRAGELLLAAQPCASVPPVDIRPEWYYRRHS